MQLIFERGDRERPVGHALIYFRGDNGAILATYVSVPPIRFDLSKFVPGFLQGALQGMDLSEGMVATPIPPIAEEVPGYEWLVALAERRQDDLVFAGGTMQSDPMRVAGETAEAAHAYGELYQQEMPVQPAAPPPPPPAQASRFEGMNEQERLNELTALTGRLRESIRFGRPDQAVVDEMAQLAATLPPKYRADRLVAAAQQPGERSQRLAELYLERSYKLFHEEYLDLDRLDREIEALAE